MVDETDGQVVLAKVDVDENPGISQAFRVQSIPAVFALKDGQVVDGFMGALPEHEVREFVERLLPDEAETMVASMIAMGDEGSLRAALEIDPGNEDAIVALAELLIARGEPDEALTLLARIPESDRTRLVAAKARVGIVPDDDHDATLTDAARPREDRRRRPAAVRRHPRADGPARPTHRRRTASSSPAASSDASSPSGEAFAATAGRLGRWRSIRARWCSSRA